MNIMNKNFEFKFNKKTIGILSSFGLIFVAAIWGFAFVIVKDSLDTIPPVYMVAIRYTIATVILAIVLNKRLLKISGAAWKHGILTGLMLGGAYISQTIGCNFTTAGKNAFLTTIYVIFIPLIAWPVYKKRPSIVVLFSAILAIVGIGLLALRNEGGSFSMNIGDILTLICGLGFAFHIVFTGFYCKEESPVVMTWIQFLVSAVISWIAAPVLDGGFSFSALNNSNAILSMLYLGVLSSLVCFLLQNICLKYMDSSLASLLLSLESVFGVIFSVIFLKEKMTALMILGCVLIFISITVAEQFNKE